MEHSQIIAKARYHVLYPQKNSYLFSLWLSTSPTIIEEIESVHYVFNHPEYPVQSLTGFHAKNGFKVQFMADTCLNEVEIIIRYKNNAEEDIYFKMSEYIGWE